MLKLNKNLVPLTGLIRFNGNWASGLLFWQPCWWSLIGQSWLRDCFQGNRIGNIK